MLTYPMAGYMQIIVPASGDSWTTVFGGCRESCSSDEAPPEWCFTTVWNFD